MTLNVTYYSPTVGATPGWSELLDPAVRLASLEIIQSAEQGEAAISSVTLDDPDGTVGHDDDHVLGLKQVAITESACPAGNRRVFTGYTADRVYRRGAGEAGSLIVEAQRQVEVTLVDINAFLDFRIFRESDAERPAETDVARVAWLLAHSFISATLIDNGLVSTSEPADMDENDYRGSKPIDVLNDCAQQSGKNYFVYYNEATGEFSLFYGFADEQTYSSSMRVSTVLADVDNSVTFAPTPDAQLTRDPSRIASAIYMAYSGGTVYESNSTTQDTYGPRDMRQDATDLKTATTATARANRLLADLATEDDRLTVPMRLPAAHINDWLVGQTAQVKFTYLPGYEDFRWVRSLRRTVAQDVDNPGWYRVTHECTPVIGTPSGAASATQVGVAYSGTPTLPRVTTPGNVLLAIMFAAGNTTRFPTAFRALDSPPVSPASPATPPFSALQTAAWTVIGTATTDYSGQNIGGPCGIGYAGPFHGGAGVCTSGLLVAAAWRYVQPGEVTTHPAQFSTEITDSQCLTFLWELPTTTPPDGTYVEADGNGGGNPSTATLPTISGNVIAAFDWALATGHAGAVSPTASAFLGAGTTLRGPIKTIPGSHAPTGMNDTTINSNVQNWGWLALLPAGGVASARVTGANTGTPYAHVNWCGLAVRLPHGITLPDIPYPGMQSA